MQITIITDRQYGIPDKKWITAGQIAKAKGLRPGSHDWWNDIREQLGIKRDN